MDLKDEFFKTSDSIVKFIKDSDSGVSITICIKNYHELCRKMGPFDSTLNVSDNTRIF